MNGRQDPLRAEEYITRWLSMFVHTVEHWYNRANYIVVYKTYGDSVPDVVSNAIHARGTMVGQCAVALLRLCLAGIDPRNGKDASMGYDADVVESAYEYIGHLWGIGQGDISRMADAYQKRNPRLSRNDALAMGKMLRDKVMGATGILVCTANEKRFWQMGIEDQEMEIALPEYPLTLGKANGEHIAQVMR